MHSLEPQAHIWRLLQLGCGRCESHSREKKLGEHSPGPPPFLLGVLGSREDEQDQSHPHLPTLACLITGASWGRGAATGWNNQSTCTPMHAHATSLSPCTGLNEPLANYSPLNRITSIHVGKKALISCPGHPVMIVSNCEPGYTGALQLERGHFPKGGDRS